MKEKTEAFLLQQLQRLQTAHDKIYSTQGYSHEVERLRLLKELVVEQLAGEKQQTRGQKNEDSDYSACSLR